MGQRASRVNEEHQHSAALAGAEAGLAAEPAAGATPPPIRPFAGAVQGSFPVDIAHSFPLHASEIDSESERDRSDSEGDDEAEGSNNGGSSSSSGGDNAGASVSAQASAVLDLLDSTGSRLPILSAGFVEGRTRLPPSAVRTRPFSSYAHVFPHAATGGSSAANQASQSEIKEEEEAPGEAHTEQDTEGDEQGEHEDSAGPIGYGGTACSAPGQLLGFEQIDAAALRCYLPSSVGAEGSEGAAQQFYRQRHGLRRSTSFTLYGKGFWVTTHMIGSCTREHKHQFADLHRHQQRQCVQVFIKGAGASPASFTVYFDYTDTKMAFVGSSGVAWFNAARDLPPPAGGTLPAEAAGRRVRAWFLAACHLVAAHACGKGEAAKEGAFADVMGQVAVRYGRRFHEEFFKAKAK